MKPSGARVVREPVQVYLAADDSALLSRLASETGLSKAEVLRRGIRSFASERTASSPMLKLLDNTTLAGWPKAAAVDHDAILSEAYRGRGGKRR
jgi:hypothetical protein